MVIPLPPLDALRADRASETQASPQEGVWLQIAILSHRAASLPGDVREAHLDRIRTLVGAPPGGEAVEAMIDAAIQMEDAARFHMALSTLDAALRTTPDDEIERRGRILAYQGRVLRQLGATTEAEERYRAAEALGVGRGELSVAARGWVGLGVIAQNRGNLPEARRLYRRVLETASAAPESRRVAHQGLMICAASAGDLGQAAQHAWIVYGESEGADRTDALVDLSETLLRGGHARAALSGFAAAIRNHAIPRLELPALGGLAVAAANALEDPLRLMLVRASARRVESLSASVNLPFAIAGAFAEIGDAFALAGQVDEARGAWQRAEAIATEKAYHEIVFRVQAAEETLALRRAQTRSTRNAAPAHIVQAIESLTPVDSLAEAAYALAGA